MHARMHCGSISCHAAHQTIAATPQWPASSPVSQRHGSHSALDVYATQVADGVEVNKLTWVQSGIQTLLAAGHLLLGLLPSGPQPAPSMPVRSLRVGMSCQAWPQCVNGHIEYHILSDTILCASADSEEKQIGCASGAAVRRSRHGYGLAHVDALGLRIQACSSLRS